MKHGKNGATVHQIKLPEAEEMARLRAQHAEQEEAERVSRFRSLVAKNANDLLAGCMSSPGSHPIDLLDLNEAEADKLVAACLTLARKVMVAAGKVPLITQEEFTGVRPEA